MSPTQETGSQKWLTVLSLTRGFWCFRTGLRQEWGSLRTVSTSWREGDSAGNCGRPKWQWGCSHYLGSGAVTAASLNLTSLVNQLEPLRNESIVLEVSLRLTAVMPAYLSVTLDPVTWAPTCPEGLCCIHHPLQQPFNLGAFLAEQGLLTEASHLSPTSSSSRVILWVQIERGGFPSEYQNLSY